MLLKDTGDLKVTLPRETAQPPAGLVQASKARAHVSTTLEQVGLYEKRQRQRKVRKTYYVRTL